MFAFNKETIIEINLKQKRWYSAGIVLNKDIFWVTGGAFHQKSTELVMLNGPNISIPGPELPMPFDGHCITKLNDSFVILNGGIENDGKTLIVNTTGKDYTMVRCFEKKVSKFEYRDTTFLTSQRVFARFKQLLSCYIR